ncbi:MAG: hypothetical protein LQ340_007805, partial [Diploschistes diacapsis]
MDSYHQYPHVPQSQNGHPVLSPLRRQHAVQPPTLLTSSPNNARGHGHGLGLSGGQTPLSTTSLSSPFSHQASSPYQVSPAGGTPAMPASSSAVYAAPYNPRQWGRIAGDGMADVGPTATLSPLHARQSSGNMQYAPRPRGPDGDARSPSKAVLQLTGETELIASPPPPYTADPAHPSPADTTSPATDFSHGTTPSSASTAFSPYVALAPNEHWSSNPAYARSGSPAVAQAAFPPPPGPSNRTRSSSRNPTERILAAMNLRSRNSAAPPQNAIEMLQYDTAHALERTVRSYAEPVAPPAARRAVSTGALGGG